MNVLRLAAFSDGAIGGNPAGVVIANELPSASEMQRVAREVGYSETVFAVRCTDRWRVRYFSPAAEVPFCGHATIALGAALVLQQGDGSFPLLLNDAEISVSGCRAGPLVAAALQSPATRSAPVAEQALALALGLFGLSGDQLDDRMAPSVACAGADHLVLMLKQRSTLSAMSYDFDRGQALMREQGWLTVLLGHAQTRQRFHVRNAFAFGGLYEDPATGAAAAALGGLLRDIAWPHGGAVELHQGDDMGVPCRLWLQIPQTAGSSISVSGTVRPM